MAGKKVDEVKQTFTYRAKPSIVKGAKKKAKKMQLTISSKIESLLIEFNKA